MPALKTIGTFIFYRKKLTEGEILWRKYLKNEKISKIPDFAHLVEEEEDALNAIRNFKITTTTPKITNTDYDDKNPAKIDVSELLCSARTCIAKRDRIGALILLTEALTKCDDSQKYNVYVMRSECLSGLQEYEKALADSQQAIKFANGVVATPYQLSVKLYISLGELENAQKIIKQNPDVFKNSEKYNSDMQAFQNILDDIYENLTDFEYCLRMIDEGLKIAPLSLEFLALKINFLVRSNRLEEAKIVDQVIHRRCGKFIWLSGALSNYYNGLLEKCNFEKITKYMHVKFINDLKEKLHDITINFEILNTKLKENNYAEAIPILHDLLNCDDFNLNVRLMIYKSFITCYLNLPNQDDNLIKYTSLVLEKESSNVNIRFARAKAYINIKECSKALDDLDYILRSAICQDLYKQVSEIHKEVKKFLELENERRREREELERKKREAEEKAKIEAEIKRKQVEELAANKKRAESLNVTANAQYKSGQYKSAISIYTEAIKLSSLTGKYYTNRSACYMALFDYEKALPDAIKAVEIDPSCWRGYLRAINCFTILGNITQAKIYIDKMQNNIPVIDSIAFNEIPKLAELEKHNSEIFQLFLQNNHTECLKHLESALKIAKECKKYKFMKAECLVMLGRIDDAKEIISIFSTEPRMIYLKGLIAFSNEQIDASLNLFREALRLDPDLKDAKKLRKIAKKIKNSYDELNNLLGVDEIHVYTNIINLLKQVNCEHGIIQFKLRAYANRGKLYYEEEQYEKAFDDCSIALRLAVPDPSNEYFVRALIYRAKVHIINKEFDFAIFDCDEALRLARDPIQILQAECIINDAKYRNKRMHVKNNFDILQVPRNSSLAVIKEAFKNLSKRFHSDKHPNATPLEKRKLERKFQEVRTAYECLRDKLLI